MVLIYWCSVVTSIHQALTRPERSTHHLIIWSTASTVLVQWNRSVPPFVLTVLHTLASIRWSFLYHRARFIYRTSPLNCLSFCFASHILENLICGRGVGGCCAGRNILLAQNHYSSSFCQDGSDHDAPSVDQCTRIRSKVNQSFWGSASITCLFLFPFVFDDWYHSCLWNIQ